MRLLFALLLLTASMAAQTKTPVQQLYDVVHQWSYQSSYLDYQQREHQFHVWVEPDGSLCKLSCSSFRVMTSAEYLSSIKQRDTEKEAVAVKMRAKATAPIAQHCKAHIAGPCKAVPTGKYGIENLKGFIAAHEEER